MLRRIIMLLGTVFLLGWGNAVLAEPAYFSDEKYQKQLKVIQAASIDCDCAIALGSDGLAQAVTSVGETGTIYVAYTSATTINDFQIKHPGLSISGLYGEVDPLKQLQLGALLTGKKAAAFYSDRSDYLTARIPSSDLIKTKKSAIRRTLSQLGDRKAIIAIPDSSIWNRDSFRLAALSLYRQGKALIGFSESMVKSGALAALYYEDAAYLDELISLLNAHKGGEAPPRTAYPQNYLIAVNTKVANSLNIKVPDLRLLMELLNEGGGNG